MFNQSKSLSIIGILLMAVVIWGVPAQAAASEADIAKAMRAPAPSAPKIESELSLRMTALGADETIAVGVWFTVPDYAAIRSMLVEKDRTMTRREAIRSALTSRISQGNQPLISLISSQGFVITYASPEAPVIFAELNPETIEELANREDVEAIYMSRVYQTAIEHAAKTDRADVVWSRGVDGLSTTLVGVVEVPEDGNPDGSRIDRPHDWLPGANDATTAFRPASPVSSHATEVAGRIAAVHNPPDRWRGIAPGLGPLLSANSDGTTAGVIQACDWALGQGAVILNLSLEYRTDFSGVPNQLARYCDWVVYNQWRTVTTVAGNEGDDVNHVVTNPGLSYNSITVGAYEDVGDNRWLNPDDWMAEFSCFNDPAGSDRELPEVVAVGRTIESPTVGNTISGDVNGTSFAAPAVAGIAALILERQPLLFNDPEVIKAIIMASACHNIEGSSRLSDQDGAGAVVACEADEIAEKQQFHFDLLADNSFDAPAPNGNWNFNGMNLERARESRVVICWSVAVGGAPNYNYPAGGPLQADLDLRVYNPDGSLAASSISYDNNYEVVEFTPTQTGIHRIEVRRHTWAADYMTWVGIAWTQDPCCSPDWGDAPDDMLHCVTRPPHGNFPTKEISDGANVREFEVEWLSVGDTAYPRATWEFDAYVDPFQNERDQDDISNINPPACIPNMDKKDDGVFPDAVYIAGTKGYVTFYVISATPNLGRYSVDRADEKIYVSGWFDWEHDDVTWAGNQMVHWVGGPGMVGTMDIGTCLEGCDMWSLTDHKKKVMAEFDVPAFLPEGPFWIRFRADYGENINTETDTATYGEIEDHISYQMVTPYFHGWHYGYDYYRPWDWPSWEYPSTYYQPCRQLWFDVPWWWNCYEFPPPVPTFTFGIAVPQTFLDIGWAVDSVTFKDYEPQGGGAVLATLQPDETISLELNSDYNMNDGTVWFGYRLDDYDLPDTTMVLYYKLAREGSAPYYLSENFHFIAGDALYGWSPEMYTEVPVTIYHYYYPLIRLDTVDDVALGSDVGLTITVENTELEMGGFDFLISYDASLLTFLSATAGQLYTDCDWLPTLTTVLFTPHVLDRLIRTRMNWPRYTSWWPRTPHWRAIIFRSNSSGWNAMIIHSTTSPWTLF